jgi:hypothetical protein
LLLIVTGLGGCASGPIRATPTPTVDVQATVDAAVHATATAQAQEEARVATAVAATQTAIPAPLAETPAGGDAMVPTPDPEAVNTEAYVTMTEEELAVLIDEAVAEAVIATDAAAASTEAAAADDALTQDEVTTIQVEVAAAEEAIALAEELLLAYAALYGDLATETVAAVEEMEALLVATTEMVVVMTGILEDVDAALDQGMEVAVETVQRLEEAAQSAAVRADALQEKAATWPQTVQADLDRRLATVLEIVPTQIAENRADAIRDAYGYVEITREALSDRRLSQQELTLIAQAGANATAGLQQQGGPQLQGVADTLNEITTGLARGEISQAQGRLQSLEGALPARPTRP